MVLDFTLSPPWSIYYKELKELFRQDPGVRMDYDENNYNLDIYVEDSAKAEAMMKLLPAVKSFGNIKMHINIIPANELVDAPKEIISSLDIKVKIREKSDEIVKPMDLFKNLFNGNPIVEDISSGTFPGSSYSISYVVFKNKVVQYFNDDLSDANNVCSTLYQDIAKRIFGEEARISFCTALDPTHPALNEPLGEWP